MHTFVEIHPTLDLRGVHFVFCKFYLRHVDLKIKRKGRTVAGDSHLSCGFEELASVEAAASLNREGPAAATALLVPPFLAINDIKLNKSTPSSCIQGLPPHRQVILRHQLGVLQSL